MIMQTEILEDVEIWAVSDGPQVFIKDGMIIGTRGFGPDLMSAQAPSLATIQALRDHSRVYNELDGTDRLITQSFTCSVETSSNTATQLTLDEVCRNAETVLRNRFVFDGNSNLQASKQWISTDGGFAIPQVIGAEIQTLAALADPRQHMRALQGHQHGVAARQGQALAGLTFKLLISH